MCEPRRAGPLSQAILYDLAVLGGGPGGVACAKRAAGLGARVVLVDADWREGRAVRGWLPKNLLAGIVRAGDIADPAGAFAGFQARRRAAVDAAVATLASDLARAGVTVVESRASLSALDDPIVLATAAGTVRARRLAVAVGAGSAWPAWTVAGVVESSEALYGDDRPLPRRLLIAGSGYVAVAQAALLRAFGVDVTLVMAEPEPLPGFDEDLRRAAGDCLAAAGVRLRPETAVRAIAPAAGAVRVETSAGTIEVDRVAVDGAGHPRPRTDALELDRFKVRLGLDGAIQVDVRYAASVPGLYAIGDCCDHAGQGLDGTTFDLAAVAVAEGEALAEHLFAAEPPPPLDYDHVPIVVPGRPELAAVGLAEARARALGFDVAVRTSHRTAPATGSWEGGFVKLVADRRSGRVLGCHLLGPGAAALAQGIALALAADVRVPQLRRCIAAPHGLAEELVALARALG